MRIDLCLMRLMRLLWNSEVEFGELAAVRLKKWKWCKKLIFCSEVGPILETETVCKTSGWFVQIEIETGRSAAAFVKHKRPEFWAPTDVATSKQFAPDYGPGCVQHKYSWKPSTNTIENPEQIQSIFQWCKSRPCVTKQQWYFFNKTPDNGVSPANPVQIQLEMQHKYNGKCTTNILQIYIL